MAEGMPEHCFDDVESFAQYLNRHHDHNAMNVDILVQEDDIIAYIEPFHTKTQVLKCDLITHPAWDAWTHLLDGDIRVQREVQQFVRAWRGTILNSAPLMAAFSAISVTGSQAMSMHIDETGATRLASTEGKTDIAAKIPSVITADVPVYEGIKPGALVNDQTYQLEVMVSVNLDPLNFSFDCPAIELIRRKARRDVAQYLRELLNDEFLVGMGSGEHSERAVKNS